jgi:hypothetical protein
MNTILEFIFDGLVVVGAFVFGAAAAHGCKVLWRAVTRAK